MSYENATPHEIRISKALPKLMKKVEKLFERQTGEPCSLMLWASPSHQRDPNVPISQQPIASYIANVDRQTMAMILAELIMRWEAGGTIPPIHLLKDASGRTLAEVLGDGGTH